MNRGFTLIEVLVVLALASFAISAGAVFSLDTPARSLCRAERDAILSLLYRARARAMNNEWKSTHGLHFDEPDLPPADKNYILFRGNFFSEADPTNEITPHFSQVPVAPHPDIIFEPLTGRLEDSMTGDIDIGSANGGSGVAGHDFPCREKILLNSEGAILW